MALISVRTRHFYLPIGHGIYKTVETADGYRNGTTEFDATVFAQQQNSKLIFRHLEAATDGGKFLLIQQGIRRIERRLIACGLGRDRQEKDKTVHHVIGCFVEQGLLPQGLLAFYAKRATASVDLQ